MTFPVYIHIGPVSLHPHLLFETLAYFVGWTQLVIVIPLAIILQGYVRTVQGILIGARITFLLTSACAGLFLTQFG
ncbi:hypothetical protein [Effusibacillus consociatus]|uniref:Uncharacterized protein n=1 Tax=Effusibacillus consociatus TaxID=1117041 RepID=A0ABV9PYQ8_9BACL